MEAIRKIVTVKDNILKVMLPDYFNGKKVELIILSTDEYEAVTPNVQEPKMDYQSLYGSVKFNKSIEEIDKELKALRDEWDRDIS